MGFWEMAFLATVQGITEFIPISSSGHLVIVQALMDIQEPGITLEIMLHMGTLLAVIAVFRRDIADMVKGLLGSVGLGERHPHGKLFWMVALASLPAGIIGMSFYSAISGLFQNPAYTYFFLIFTGMYLLVNRFLPDGPVRLDGVGPVRAFLIGVSQVLTMLPGISRSGTTITTGKILGLERETAARFSFLMSIPAVAGAGLYEARHIRGVETSYLLLASGVLISFLVGVLAIKALLKVILAKKLHYFGYYCLFAGTYGLFYLL